MHPGPMNRGVEIDSDVADDLNVSLIQDQVERASPPAWRSGLSLRPLGRRPMTTLAIVNARLLDPASDYDGPGALLVEDGRIAR